MLNFPSGPSEVFSSHFLQKQGKLLSIFQEGHSCSSAIISQKLFHFSRDFLLSYYFQILMPYFSMLALDSLSTFLAFPICLCKSPYHHVIKPSLPILPGQWMVSLCPSSPRTHLGHHSLSLGHSRAPDSPHCRNGSYFNHHPSVSFYLLTILQTIPHPFHEAFSLCCQSNRWVRVRMLMALYPVSPSLVSGVALAKLANRSSGEESRPHGFNVCTHQGSLLLSCSKALLFKSSKNVMEMDVPHPFGGFTGFCERHKWNVC